MSTHTPYRLVYNSRFYILAFSLLLSVAVFAWLRLTIESDQLVAIRTQQLYGFISLAFWYVALIISPLGKVIGKHRMKHIEFSRRAIGVSAFYFAALHAGVALFGQLGGIEQLQYLPDIFKASLALGVIALVVLGLMSATSFDWVIRLMTFPRWKWLHRLVYGAGVLAILHVWMIGTHLAYSAVQLVGLVALALLAGLEMIRIIRHLNGRYLRLARADAAVLALATWAMVVVLIAALPSLVDNYHSRHTDHSQNTDLE